LGKCRGDGHSVTSWPPPTQRYLPFFPGERSGVAFNITDKILVNADGKGGVGEWRPAPIRGYAGVQFDIGGSNYYGWLDISVTDFRPLRSTFSATLHSYAYEDVADTAILAGNTGVPEPSILFLFGISGVAMTVVRRSSRRRGFYKMT
jgi:hypothetical protein